MIVAKPRSEVFDWVADYHHVPEVMEGVKTWRPIGDQAEGVGARYRVELDQLLVPLTATLVIVEWKRPEAIGWASESSPVANRGRWTFSTAKMGTRVRLQLNYRPPAGALGNFVAGRAEFLVRRRILRALDDMKAALEAEP